MVRHGRAVNISTPVNEVIYQCAPTGTASTWQNLISAVSRVAMAATTRPNASRLSICEQGCDYVAISVGQAFDHSNARNFLKLPFIASINFSLFRLVVNPELVIRPKNDLLARRSFPSGDCHLAALFGDGGD
jgi:hypothetical protein